jgi:hypothetical protein
VPACLREVRDRSRMNEQKNRGHDGQHELHHDPVVPEQLPRRTEGGKESGQERGETQRHDDVPRRQVHRHVRGADHVPVAMRQTARASGRNDATAPSQPTDEVTCADQSELAYAGRHHHDGLRSMPAPR